MQWSDVMTTHVRGLTDTEPLQLGRQLAAAGRPRLGVQIRSPGVRNRAFCPTADDRTGD